MRIHYCGEIMVSYSDVNIVQVQNKTKCTVGTNENPFPEKKTQWYVTPLT